MDRARWEARDPAGSDFDGAGEDCRDPEAKDSRLFGRLRTDRGRRTVMTDSFVKVGFRKGRRRRESDPLRFAAIRVYDLGGEARACVTNLPRRGFLEQQHAADGAVRRI